MQKFADTLDGEPRVKTIGMMTHLPGFGVVWFNEESVANVLSLALVSDQRRLMPDTDVTQSFLFVHKDNGLARQFDGVSSDLHACDVREDDMTALVTTSSGQKETTVLTWTVDKQQQQGNHRRQ